MIKLLETRIDYLLQSGISNITDKYLNLRFEPEARTEIQLIQVNYHTQSDYLELVFWVTLLIQNGILRMKQSNQSLINSVEHLMENTY